MSNFMIDTAVFADIASAEKTIAGFKDSSKENSKAANQRKISAYSVLIASLAGAKLAKGNLPRAVSNQVRKALLEDAGLNEATAKRYLENSVGALRIFDIPSQATAELVEEILVTENITSENQLAKRINGDAEKDGIRDLVERLVGRFTSRKDENGQRVQGLFKPSKFDDDDFERFDNMVRELKAARAASFDAAAIAESQTRKENDLADEVFSGMQNVA